jgi:hypothetical protein
MLRFWETRALNQVGRDCTTHHPSAVHLQFIHDEMSDLALALMHDEPGMQLFEARTHAGLMLDALVIYATSWDHLAL